MNVLHVNFFDVMERVALILEAEEGKKPYDKNIASALGISPTQYANNKKRNSVPYREVAVFCHLHGITINWVLFGDSGQRLIEKEEKVYKIRLLDNLSVSAGGGAYCDEEAEAKYVFIDKESAEKLGITNTKSIDAVRVVGDSMHPTIKENSTILIDKTKNSLSSDGVYVVNTNSGVFVKRLALNPNGGIDLISDNKLYDTITMPLEEVSIVGKVVGTLGKV